MLSTLRSYNSSRGTRNFLRDYQGILSVLNALPGKNDNTGHAGRRLRRKREELNLRVRDVYLASTKIALRLANDDYEIHIGRLSEIENNGVVPSIYKLYTLCAIYRIDLIDVLEWYGIDLSQLPADASSIDVSKTHTVSFHSEGHGGVTIPLALDPGLDLRKTTYISRMIQRWGKLPLMLLSSLDLKNHRYAFVGTDDWSMYPLIHPGSLLLIDETRRKVVTAGWTNEFERPIYFLEHRDGYTFGWCSLGGNQLTVLPHPASNCNPSGYTYPDEIDIVGQVVGVAMRLDHGKRRRPRS
jgi:hypothetical protein